MTNRFRSDVFASVRHAVDARQMLGGEGGGGTICAEQWPLEARCDPAVFLQAARRLDTAEGLDYLLIGINGKDRFHNFSDDVGVVMALADATLNNSPWRVHAAAADEEDVPGRDQLAGIVQDVQDELEAAGGAFVFLYALPDSPVPHLWYTDAWEGDWCGVKEAIADALHEMLVERFF